MIRVRVSAKGFTGFTQALSAFPEKLQTGLEARLNQLGEEEVEIVKTTQLSGPTSSTSTQVRTGERRDAYGHAVEKTDKGMSLFVGPSRSPSGRVPRQSRIWEGRTDGGGFRSFWVITPKAGKALRFPLRDGNVPGLAKEGITKWVFAKSVTQYALGRPTLDNVHTRLTRKAPQLVKEAVSEALSGG